MILEAFLGVLLGVVVAFIAVLVAAFLWVWREIKRDEARHAEWDEQEAR